MLAFPSISMDPPSLSGKWVLNYHPGMISTRWLEPPYVMDLGWWPWSYWTLPQCRCVCDRLKANHSYTILFGMDGMVLNQSWKCKIGDMDGNGGRFLSHYFLAFFCHETIWNQRTCFFGNTCRKPYCSQHLPACWATASSDSSLATRIWVLVRRNTRGPKLGLPRSNWKWLETNGYNSGNQWL